MTGIPPAARRGDDGLWSCRRNGLLHRDDGPAVFSDDGVWQEWRRDGHRHRDDGPALIAFDSREWYRDGEHHRDDGPAVERANGESWYARGKLHRVDGPALTRSADNRYPARVEHYLHGWRVFPDMWERWRAGDDSFRAAALTFILDGLEVADAFELAAAVTADR